MTANAATRTRVLQIISSMNPDFGGPPEGAGQICRALRARGVGADLASLDVPAARWDCDCAMFRFGPSRLGRYHYNRRLFAWLKSNARSYAAVIVHGLWQFHGLATRLALKGTGVPYYVFPHGMLDPWFKRQYPMKHLKKEIYWRWGEYLVLRDARAVLFTTEEERQLARGTFRRYRANEAVVGYGIADPPRGERAAVVREAFLQHFPALQGKRLMLFLGRLHPKKGCDLLIDAFATVAHRDPALQLVMVGPDEQGYRTVLERHAHERGVSSRITWTGKLNGDAKWGAYHSAEVFALPSHQENFGISVAEALACGVPVLISNKVNIWREIEAAAAGLVAKDTLGATTGVLANWLDLTGSMREEMGRNARDCYRNHFHIDATAERLLHIIEENRCPPQHICAA